MATITHIAEHGTVPSDYRMQIEFSMLVTKRTSWHFYAYHPDLPAAHVLVKPDADVAELLASQIKACINRRDAIVQALSPTQQSEAA
jgi:hypothetical protein